MTSYATPTTAHEVTIARQWHDISRCRVSYVQTEESDGDGVVCAVARFTLSTSPRGWRHGFTATARYWNDSESNRPTYGEDHFALDRDAAAWWLARKLLESTRNNSNNEVTR
jgi:hypothetical protein